MDKELYIYGVLPDYEKAMNLIVALLENIRADDRREAITTGITHIDNIEKRLKAFKSFSDKCKEKNVDMDDHDNVKSAIKDIAGVRITCRTKEDCHDVVKKIKHLPMVSIDREKDYIRNPKANGYSSIHLNTTVSIYDSEEGAKNVPVEIQITTMSFNIWASTEHFRYNDRRKVGDYTTDEETNRLFQELSEVLSKADDLVSAILERNKPAD